MAKLRLKSITKNWRKKSVNGKKSRYSWLLIRNSKLLARSIKGVKRKDLLKGVKKVEKLKERDTSRERIEEEISTIIRTTKIIKKKIKSCLKN